MTGVQLQIMFSVQAALFAGLWLVYLRKLDVFNAEKWVNMVLVFLVGLGTPLIVLYAPDAISGPRLNGQYWNDFEEYFLRVGLIEELAKLAPLLLVVFFTKFIDEPIDYVIYAALLALGFSATENVLYMNRYDPSVLAVRGLISSLGHICFTSIAIYGWVEGKYRYKKWAVLYFVWAFVLAALAHALFDWILTIQVAWKLPLFIVFYIFLLEVWALIINNSLNNSPHYTKKTVVDDYHLQFQMRAGFIINAIMQAIITYLIVGDGEKSMGVYATCLLSVAFFFFFVSNRLTHFTIVPKKWYTLFPKLPVKADSKKTKPPGEYKKAWLFNIKGTDANESLISTYIEQDIELVPLSNQELPIRAVIKGRLEDKLFLQDDEVFYLFRSSGTLPDQQFHQHLLVLKAFDGSPGLINDKYPVMAVMAVPTDTNWDLSYRYHRKNFPFIQWMAIKPLGDQKIIGHRVTDLS